MTLPTNIYIYLILGLELLHKILFVHRWMHTFTGNLKRNTHKLNFMLITKLFVVFGASLSEPLLDELAGAFLWYIYIYIS